MARKTFALQKGDAVGEKNNFAKLTEAKVRQIRNLWTNTGMTQKDIAEKFEINPSAVSHIVHGRRWGHVK